jgi:hypothetical protein
MTHDAYAERAVVGAILASGKLPEDLRTILRPDDIYDPHLRAVAEVAWDLPEIDPLIVRTELLRRGVRGQAVDGVWLVDLQREGLPVAGPHHARIVKAMSVRRQVITAAGRAIQQAENPSLDPYDVAAALHVQAGVLAERDDPAVGSTARDLHDFIDGTLDYDWLIPDLIERGDRVLITAGEGGGKSVLLRQLSVCAAAGVNPFSGERHDPLKVLMVDLENGERTLRRNLIDLKRHADAIGRPVPLRGLMVESIPAGVDLTRPDGESWLTRLCEDHQPQILSIGPLYRMHVADVGKEEPARQLTRVIDAVRARHGCAVLMETHAPHGVSGQQRSLRPIGSSLFLRWPEFGFGIRQNEDGISYKLVRWRGPRDERPGWPQRLRRGVKGADWPWCPDDDRDYSRPGSVRSYWNSLDDGGESA